MVRGCSALCRPETRQFFALMRSGDLHCCPMCLRIYYRLHRATQDVAALRKLRSWVGPGARSCTAEDTPDRMPRPARRRPDRLRGGPGVTTAGVGADTPSSPIALDAGTATRTGTCAVPTARPRH
jgi:hypothetical protein